MAIVWGTAAVAGFSMSAIGLRRRSDWKSSIRECLARAGAANEARRHLREEKVHRQRYQRLVTLAQELAPPGRWLDIGCGTGTLLRVAEEHGIAIDGIELMPARRDVARQQTSARIYEQPLEDLRLPDASYAAVFMVNVFSHLFSPSATFAEIRRILVARRHRRDLDQRDRPRRQAHITCGTGDWATICSS